MGQDSELQCRTPGCILQQPVVVPVQAVHMCTDCDTVLSFAVLGVFKMLHGPLNAGGLLGPLSLKPHPVNRSVSLGVAF